MKSMKIIDRIGYIAFANFLLFMILSLEIGGDALTGFIKDGEYFVSDHGKHTQVAAFIWYLNRALGLGAFVFIPLAIILQFLYYLYRLLHRLLSFVRHILPK